MKKCKYCAENIQDEAIKCKHCGETLIEAWYFKTPFVITTFFVVGPLALPLLWLHPRYPKRTKILMTGLMLFLTLAFGSLFYAAARTITDYYRLAF